MTAIAPIALFVYKRPEHTRRVLESLVGNPLLLESPFVIYCDGPKRPEDHSAVEETRRVVKAMAPAHAVIVEQQFNKGLANSIIHGVTELCNAHGQVIVVEDDLILSPCALEYFNRSLERYKDESRVMHIAGYMYPVRRRLPEAFFYREATCWGWATWSRAWAHFEADAAAIQEFVRESDLVSEFNVQDTMFFWQMLEQQRVGRIDSWAIRWYGSMFMRQGLALHPGKSLVRNEGFDSTGEHCGKTDQYEVSLSSQVPAFPDRIEESREALRAMMEHRSALKRNDRTKRVGTEVRRVIRRLVNWVKP